LTVYGPGQVGLPGQSRLYRRKKGWREARWDAPLFEGSQAGAGHRGRG